MSEDRMALVRALNDRLRVHHVGGRIVLTSGVMERGGTFVINALAAVQAFSAFSPDNDPYDEHDFGAVDVASDKLFWKIDYYDSSLRAGADDPSCEQTCVRVLTLMLAEEY